MERYGNMTVIKLTKYVFNVPNWDYCNKRSSGLAPVENGNYCRFCVKATEGRGASKVTTHQCLLFDKVLDVGTFTHKCAQCKRMSAGYPGSRELQVTDKDLVQARPEPQPVRVAQQVTTNDNGPIANPKHIMQVALRKFRTIYKQLVDQGVSPDMALDIAEKSTLTEK
jgi:hypothetical protein